MITIETKDIIKRLSDKKELSKKVPEITIFIGYYEIVIDSKKLPQYIAYFRNLDKTLKSLDLDIKESNFDIVKGSDYSDYRKEYSRLTYHKNISSEPAYYLGQIKMLTGKKANRSLIGEMKEKYDMALQVHEQCKHLINPILINFESDKTLIITSVYAPKFKGNLTVKSVKFQTANKVVPEIETSIDKVYKWIYKTSFEGKRISCAYEFKASKIKEMFLSLEYEYINILDNAYQDEHDVNNNVTMTYQSGKTNNGVLSLFNFKKNVNMLKDIFKKDLIKTIDGNIIRYEVVKREVLSEGPVIEIKEASKEPESIKESKVFIAPRKLIKHYYIVENSSIKTSYRISKFQTNFYLEYFGTLQDAKNYLQYELKQLPVDIKSIDKQVMETYQATIKEVSAKSISKELSFSFTAPIIIKPFKVLDNIVIDTLPVNAPINPLRETLFTEVVNVITEVKELIHEPIKQILNNLQNTFILLSSLVLSFILNSTITNQNNSVNYPVNLVKIEFWLYQEIAILKIYLFKSKVIIIFKSFLLISAINKFIGKIPVIFYSE